MSQISLKEFADQIRQRIDEERASEAIPMAQYLLRQYPRYLKGYELLAEAALYQGNIKDAIEVFRRVLSADPENLLAYRGMAAAYTQEEEIGEALWYMMRAFERDPRVRGVRQELRELYEQRDGRRPGRLNLNRAALARMYMREGLYHRAIEELNIELETPAHTPTSDRVDLFMALAEAQWFANQRYEAVETARKVCLELPYCLKANLILGEFYAQQGDLESADIHLRIVQQMDPENELAVELFGKSAYLQPNVVMIESLDEAWKGALQGSDEEHKMPEWLADLSLFATAEPQEQEVDWDAIIAYESDWRTILAKTTHEAIQNFVPNWRIDLRHATRLSLKERQDEQAEYPIFDAPEERLPLILEPTEQTFPPLLDLEKVLPSWEAEEEEEVLPSAKWEAEAEEEEEVLPSAKWEAEEALPSAPLIPAVGKAQAVDWREALLEATWKALKDAPVQPSSSKAMTKEELAIALAWKEDLRAETEHWLGRIELDVPEQVEPATPLSETPEAAPLTVEPRWINTLAAATRAYLSAAEQAREALQSQPEQIVPAKAAWVEALRQESETRLTSVEMPESLPEVIEPAKAAWVEPLWQKSLEAVKLEQLGEEAKVSSVALRLGKEWRAALRAETEDLLAQREAITISEEEEVADIKEILAQPIKAVPIQPAEVSEEEVAIETTVIPLPAEAEWARALREETEQQLEAFSLAPWVISLRSATAEELESLSAAETAWAISLRDDTQRQLEAASAATTAWASALRHETGQQLQSLSVAEAAWVKGLRHLTEQQLLTLSSNGTTWANNLHQETKKLLRWMDDGHKGWISHFEHDTQDALNAYQEAHHSPQVPLGVPSSQKPEISWQLPAEEPPATIPAAPVARRQEADISTPVTDNKESDSVKPVEDHQEADIATPVEARQEAAHEPVQSDFIASLMAAAEKVTEDEGQLSEVAADFWDDIQLEGTQSQLELSFDGAKEEAIAPPIAPPVKDEPKAKEETFTQPPAPSEKVAGEAPQKETIKPPARPTKPPLIKKPQADKAAVVEEKASVVPAPSEPSEAKPMDEWQTARWLWETKQYKQALEIYQRLFNERQAPNEKLEEELSAWTKTGQASAHAYQLLGDLYRRMGRMQDAVAQYREAINRM